MLIVPVYNFVVLPYTEIILQLDKLKEINNDDIKVGNKILFLISKDKVHHGNFNMDFFYPIGVIGVLREINSNGFVVIETNERVNIDNVHYEGNQIQFGLSLRSDINDLDSDVEKLKLGQLKNALNEFVSRFQWGTFVRKFIMEWKSISEIVCALSMWFFVGNDEKYSLLLIDSVKERTDKMEQILYEYMEMEEVNNEASNHQEMEYKKIYRESAIRKQMDYLQKELDELHPDNLSDIDKFENKIKESGMSDEASREAMRILNRMKQDGERGPEYGMFYDYLEFITGLSWKKEKFKRIDIGKAESILDDEHYGLRKVKKRIISQIAVMNLKKSVSGTILLFVGPPGCGKTSIGQSIAHAMGRKYVRISLGGIRDEADIRGHRRTYIGAMAGRIMNAIYKCGVNNPVMVLDEVDKLSNSLQGNPADALLEVLDPEQNHSFTDHYLNVSYDLSDVVFICTANSLDNIPEALLNRMEVIEFNGYTSIEKFHIARLHLVVKSYDEIGLDKRKFKITDGAIRRLIKDYTMEAGVRELKRVIDSLFREAAVMFVNGSCKELTVTAKTVDNYLDLKPIRHDSISKIKSAGIVTGLAWTRAGGEILFIETMFSRGKGNVIITGRLGDVMKESVRIAISLVKGMFPDKVNLFLENDLHVHVPEGAVPKDGPSAGITLTVALASLVTDCKVSGRVAMTGEVSLSGDILPIGGLSEKLMAADRAGITKVFIPKANIIDLDDVPKEVKDKLDIISVSCVRDVLKKLKIIDK